MWNTSTYRKYNQIYKTEVNTGNITKYKTQADTVNTPGTCLLLTWLIAWLILILSQIFVQSCDSGLVPVLCVSVRQRLFVFGCIFCIFLTFFPERCAWVVKLMKMFYSFACVSSICMCLLELRCGALRSQGHRTARHFNWAAFWMI